MFALGLACSLCCYPENDLPEVDFWSKQLNTAGKRMVVASAAEAFIMVTALVIGILGACGAIAMPSALSGSLIALGTVIAIPWLILTVFTKGDFIIHPPLFALHWAGLYDASHL